MPCEQFPHVRAPLEHNWLVCACVFVRSRVRVRACDSDETALYVIPLHLLSSRFLPFSTSHTSTVSHFLHHLKLKKSFLRSEKENKFNKDTAAIWKHGYEIHCDSAHSFTARRFPKLGQNAHRVHNINTDDCHKLHIFGMTVLNFNCSKPTGNFTYH